MYLPIAIQKMHINNIIEGANSLSNGKCLGENSIAITTDTHGDFMSMLGSLVESGAVSVRRNDFTYYDREKNVFLSKEEFLSLKIKQAEDNKRFCVFPTPYPNENFKGELYHLGDIGDRGKESVMSFAFLCKLNENYEKQRGIGNSPIHIAIGNHESTQCELSGGDACDLYRPLLAKMIGRGYIKTGYIVGKGEKATALWHSRYLDTDMPHIFSELKNALIKKSNPDYYKPFLDSIAREFNSEPELCNKILKFFQDSKKTSKFDEYIMPKSRTESELMQIINENFSPIELAKIKMLVGDGIVKKDFDDQGNFKGNGDIDDAFLITPYNERDNGSCCIFWNRDRENGLSVIQQIIGHDAEKDAISTILKSGKLIVQSDSSRSFGYRGNETLISTNYYIVDSDGNINPLEIECNSNHLAIRNANGSVESIAKNYPINIKGMATKNIDINNTDIFKYQNKMAQSETIRSTTSTPILPLLKVIEYSIPKSTSAPEYMNEFAAATRQVHRTSIGKIMASTTTPSVRVVKPVTQKHATQPPKKIGLTQKQKTSTTLASGFKPYEPISPSSPRRAPRRSICNRNLCL